MPQNPELFYFAVAQPVALLVAYGLGLLASRFLRGRVTLSGSSIAVVSFVGMSIGMVLAGWFASNNLGPLWLNALGWSLGVDVVLLIVASAVAARLYPRKEAPTIAEVIARGETDQIEFKSSARCNMHTGKRDDRMEHVVAKTLAAFMNSSGGTLLLGVSDDGEMLGLGPDFRTLKTPDADRFELWLRDFLATSMGRNAAAVPKLDFHQVPDSTELVCRVTCAPSPVPVYVRSAKGGVHEFWVRVGNSTRLFEVNEAVDYVESTWPSSFRSLFRGRFRRIRQLN